MEEIELFESSREREHYDNLADLYAVIVATEHLERAYARDAITRVEVRKKTNMMYSVLKEAFATLIFFYIHHCAYIVCVVLPSTVYHRM